MPRKNKHQGGVSELIACAWLLSQGYEVFRNVSAVGPVDIVGLKDGKTHLFDVKSVLDPLLKQALHQPQVDMGVKALYVDRAGRCEINWDTKSVHDFMEDRPCVKCQTVFAPRRRKQRFCSSNCRLYYHVDLRKEAENSAFACDALN